MAPALGIDKESFKGPSIAVLDKDFNVLGLFEERPQVVRDMPSFDDIKLEYYKGKYLLDTVNDFIKILKNYKFKIRFTNTLIKGSEFYMHYFIAYLIYFYMYKLKYVR